VQILKFWEFFSQFILSSSRRSSNDSFFHFSVRVFFCGISVHKCHNEYIKSHNDDLYPPILNSSKLNLRAIMNGVKALIWEEVLMIYFKEFRSTRME
jgi:hypothetical protein